MKVIELIFNRGRLIRKDNMQEFSVKEGTEVMAIVNDENDLQTENQFLARPEILSSAEKLKSLKEKHKRENLVLLFNANTNFVFRIGLSKRRAKEKMEYLFKCIILEDLYMHGFGDDPLSYGLSGCVCETIKCLEGDCPLPAVIPAKSLNELYNKTVTHLFPLQRAPSGNAFNEFFLLGDTSASIWDVKNKCLQKLEFFRHNKLKQQQAQLSNNH